MLEFVQQLNMRPFIVAYQILVGFLHTDGKHSAVLLASGDIAGNSGYNKSTIGSLAQHASERGFEG